MYQYERVSKDKKQPIILTAFTKGTAVNKANISLNHAVRKVLNNGSVSGFWISDSNDELPPKERILQSPHRNDDINAEKDSHFTKSTKLARFSSRYELHGLRSNRSKRCYRCKINGSRVPITLHLTPIVVVAAGCFCSMFNRNPSQIS